MQPRADLETHLVTNQPEEPGDLDLWRDDPVLRDHATPLLVGDEPAALAAQGARLGRADLREAARQAERPGPELRLFDRGGRRLDEVLFPPAYHDFLTLGLQAGYAGGPWTGGSHAAHAALVYLHSHVEPGTCCPMTMTYAAVPALAADPDLSALWRPRLTARGYDPRAVPLGRKGAATMGMAMTEKQGGSDLRQTASRAEPADGHWRLTGHKWFCSAPMSDGFLTLAQAPGGLTCFVVPRWTEEEGRNGIRLLRLKDKLGNRANASAEIEYVGARAWRLGDEGAGIRTIMAMVQHTRLDTAMAPAGLMRAALAEALRWCRGRSAFGARLIDQPLMRSLLADLALDCEGATALGLHVAGAFDDPGRAAFARIGVALAKFANNKLCVPVVAEAMEVLGGMGYVADTPLPMLYREAPLNGIWEGAGNVICLDVVRALRDAPTAAALDGELDAARGRVARYDRVLARFRRRWAGAPPPEEARVYAERAAQLLTASVVLRRAPAPVAEGYVLARLAGRGRFAGGGAGMDPAPILDRLGPG